MNSIYALVDPRSHELRYIGKTRNPAERLRSHCNSRTKTHSSRWVQTLKAAGVAPKMVILEKGLSEDQWPEREKYWIAHYKALGADLTNITEGGHHVVTIRQSVDHGCIVINKDWAAKLAEDKALRGSEHRVLWLLIGTMNGDNMALTTQASIAEELGMPKSQVSVGVKKLVESGAISKRQINGIWCFEVHPSLASRGTLKVGGK